ncbi:MAG: hypothetical protein ABJM82_00180 [Shimia thalassica]|uniref:hypothetical protein n=1 Tax=Shimia thalassica TaxID=1715693 RepID=UPI0032988EFB
MQNRYVGDIGDFAKYSLLNALSKGKNLGVAWYLYPDEGHNNDGKHTKYLHYPEQWRSRSPRVFDGLHKLVQTGTRNVGSVVQEGIIKPAAVADECLHFVSPRRAEKELWRKQWFDRVRERLENCDMIFADPDNGLCQNEKFKGGSSKDWKRLPLEEAKSLSEGRIAIFYHHNSRFKGGHELENKYWAKNLEHCTFSVRFRAYSARTFFVVNADTNVISAAKLWTKAMGSKAEFMMHTSNE